MAEFFSSINIERFSALAEGDVVGLGSIAADAARLVVRRLTDPSFAFILVHLEERKQAALYSGPKRQGDPNPAPPSREELNHLLDWAGPLASKLGQLRSIEVPEGARTLLDPMLEPLVQQLAAVIKEAEEAAKKSIRAVAKTKLP